MANTKVTGDLIASGTITADNLVSGTLDTLLNSYLTTNTYATQGYVTTAVNNLIDAAPASLDTLNELAAALNDDANFATTVTNSLATKLNLSGGTLTGTLYAGGLVRLTGTTSSNSQLDLPVDWGALRWYDGTTFKGGIGTAGWSGVGSGNDLTFYLNNGNLHISNNTSPFVTFDRANERVGIGTTSPNTKLHVESSSYDDFIKLTRTGVGSMGITATSPRGIQTTDGSGNFLGWHVDSSGKMGIGTPYPDYRLVVSGTGTERVRVGSTNNTTAGVYFTVRSAGSLVGNGTIATQNNGDMRFFTGTNSESEKMRITSSGNVGIGTTSPEDKLHVANGGLRVSTTANSNHLSIKNIQTSTASTAFEKKIRFLGYNNVEEASIVGLGNQYWGSAYNGIGFNVGTTRRMTINNSGDVNIGNGSSSGSLYFENDVKTRKIVLYSGAGNDNEFYGFGIESNTLVYSTYTANDDHVFFSGYSGGRNELMRVKGSGKIGIGTSSPHSKLHVEGDISQTSNSKTIVFSKTLSDNVGTDIAGFTGFTGDPSAATILVTVVVNASSGYAVETHRYLWNLRKATAGRSRSVTTLTGADQGSVNSGVVSIVSVTPVALYNSYERFRLSVNLTGISTCVVYVKMEALGENIRGLNPM